MSSDDPKQGSGSSSTDSGTVPTIASSSSSQSLPPGARTGTVAGTGALPQARATGSAGPGTGSHAVQAAPTGPSILGQTIDGRYKIVDKLGEGGMGEVYAAEHVHIAKKVAIKLLRPEILANEEAVSRFRQEARSASSIGHTNIISIEDFGQLGDGRIYMCMEYLDGAPLNEVIKQAIDPARALNILIQTGHGLAAAHAKGIVHRDMKPENIFVTGAPPVETPKLLDFGIAKVSGNEGNNHLTRTGTIFGTPYYMAPEQALGQAIDHRADIYAMGIIMFEVFCGAVPFQADSFMAILTQHITAPAPSPSQVATTNGRALPAGLEPVIARCMQKEPDDRFASMDELVAALIGVYQGVAGAGMSAYFDAHQPPPSGAHPVSSGDLSSVIPAMRPGTNSSSNAAMGRAATEAVGDSLAFQQPSRGKGLLVMVLMLLLAGAGGGGYYLYQQGQNEAVAGDDSADSKGKNGRSGKRGKRARGDEKVAIVDDPGANDPTPGDPDAPPVVEPPVQPGTVITPPAEGDEPEPETITVLVNSKPQGAKVYRDDKLMGRTPLNVAVVVGEPVELELRRSRYEDTAVMVDGSNDKMTFSLDRKRRPGKPDPKTDKPDPKTDKTDPKTDKTDPKTDKTDKTDKTGKPPVNPDVDILE